MKINRHLIIYFLMMLLVLGITIDTLETVYALKIGLQESNPITLFFINIVENSTAGVLISGTLKTLILIVLYAWSIMIKNDVVTLGIFSKRFIILGMDISIILFLVIFNYLTYSVVWNNLILIVG